MPLLKLSRGPVRGSAFSGYNNAFHLVITDLYGYDEYKYSLVAEPQLKTTRIILGRVL